MLNEKKNSKNKVQKFKDFLKNYPIIINPSDELKNGLSNSQTGMNQSPGDSTSKDLSFSEETDIEKKSKESGISTNILKKIHDKNLTGKKPKARANQRMDSFIKGGDARKDNKDLWNKHQKTKSRKSYYKQEVEGHPRGIDANKPLNREEGTNTLVSIYKKDTPGEK